MSAYAPFNLSYSATTPYLTTAEYLNAPTAIDVTQLKVSGSTLDQTAILAEVISRVSSAIDRHCCGRWGSLCATVDVENGVIWGDRTGRFAVHPKYVPILEVQSFSYGTSMTYSASVTPSSSVWIEPDRFVVQPSPILTSSLSLNFGGVGPRRFYAQWTYVNGWPNTTLSVLNNEGDTSITPVNVTGIYPGTGLTIFDPPNDEQIMVASTYSPGASVVPLVAPLAYAHAAGVSVTNLPQAVKDAAILWVSGRIKRRGDSGFVLPTSWGSEPTQQTGSSSKSSGGSDSPDIDAAKSMLRDYRMISGGQS
jgi:hypothetical protein